MCQPPDESPTDSNEAAVRVWVFNHIQLLISMNLKPFVKMIKVVTILMMFMVALYIAISGVHWD